MALVISALGIRGAVHALDAARWRLRTASLEPPRGSGPGEFVCPAAGVADAELAKIIDGLIAHLADRDREELGTERERCAAVRERRWKPPVGGVVCDNRGATS